MEKEEQNIARVSIRPLSYNLIFEDKYGRLLGVERSGRSTQLVTRESDYKRDHVEKTIKKKWSEFDVSRELNISKFGPGSGFHIYVCTPNFDNIHISFRSKFIYAFGLWPITFLGE